MATLLELQDERAAVLEEAELIRAKALEEKRDWTPEETTRITECCDQADELTHRIEQHERLDKQMSAVKEPAGRRTAPTDPETGDPMPQVPQNQQVARRQRVDVVQNRANHGFPTLGHWAHACIHGTMHPSEMDPRLRARMAATTYGTEGTGADGGFSVPPEFRNEIMTLVAGEESLLGRTMQLSTGGNSITFPADETTPWNTSGGIYAEWEGEGDAAAQKKPSLKQDTIRANKLVVLANLTDELLDDAAAMTTWLRATVPTKIEFKVNLAIVQGTGAGQPLGIMNAGGLVSVAKESGQSADTIMANNIRKMWARCYAGARANAVWLCSQSCEAQLMQMEHAGDNRPLFTPSNSLANAPHGSLLGRPIILTEACEEVGDTGDIILAGLDRYVTVTKGSGIQEDTSIHFYFDQGITAVRFVLRIGGQPLWSTTISARDGSNTYAPFVKLDARA